MSELMKLYLTEFGADEVYGIYGADEDKLAARMRFLHPEAATSFVIMDAEIRIRCSDMLRTAEGSLLNRRRKGRGLRPGWSGHNYGFSIDIDYGWIMVESGLSKVELDEWMAGHGWYCHNVPGETRRYEAWHYNYFGSEAEHYLSFRTKSKRTWATPVSTKIEDYYGHWWKNAGTKTIQTALKSLKMYNGDIDGDYGELLKEAVYIFQRAWDLSEDGVVGPMTGRTLMLVSAEKILVDTPC